MIVDEWLLEVPVGALELVVEARPNFQWVEAASAKQICRPRPLKRKISVWSFEAVLPKEHSNCATLNLLIFYTTVVPTDQRSWPLQHEEAVVVEAVVEVVVLPLAAVEEGSEEALAEVEVRSLLCRL